MARLNPESARWRDMSRVGFFSAKRLYDAGDYRGCANRAYYAAYHAGTALCVEHGDDFARGWNNPAREQLPDLIRMNGSLSVVARRRIGKLLRALRDQREDADYRPGRTVGKVTALDAPHATTSVLELLKIFDDT